MIATHETKNAKFVLIISKISQGADIARDRIVIHSVPYRSHSHPDSGEALSNLSTLVAESDDYMLTEYSRNCTGEENKTDFGRVEPIQVL